MSEESSFELNNDIPPNTFGIGEVVARLANGERLSRTSWERGRFICARLVDESLVVFLCSREHPEPNVKEWAGQWEVVYSDLFATDWFELEL